MSFELRTFLTSSGRSSQREAHLRPLDRGASLGRVVSRSGASLRAATPRGDVASRSRVALLRHVAFLAVSAAILSCDGDTPGGSSTSGTGSPPGPDVARDRGLDEGSAGASGDGSEAGDLDAAMGDGVPPDGVDDVDDGPPGDADDAGARDADDDAPTTDGALADASPDFAAGDATDDLGDASLDGADDVTDAASDVPRDTGPIVIGPPFRRFARFAVFGDYGMATTDEARVSNLVHSWNVDFIVTTGDNNYTGLSDGIDGVIGRYYSDFIGNYWGSYGPGSRTTRFWPSPGNHDWDVDNLVAYADYFTLPGNERYYDVDLGIVHLFAVDSDPREPDGTTADSVQGQWLQASLARSTSCFNVVYFHHPAYSSGPHGSTLDMRWPFEAWGADVVLAGHDHVYERFEVGQIPYFTVGLGGGPPYGFVTTIPESRMQFNADFGAMRVTANRRGIRFEFFDANGTLVESFSTQKRCR